MYNLHSIRIDGALLTFLPLHLMGFDFCFLLSASATSRTGVDWVGGWRVACVVCTVWDGVVS